MGKNTRGKGPGGTGWRNGGFGRAGNDYLKSHPEQDKLARRHPIGMISDYAIWDGNCYREPVINDPGTVTYKDSQGEVTIVRCKNVSGFVLPQGATLLEVNEDD